MSNSSSSTLSSFTHSPARLRLVPAPRRAADKSRRGPALRTFGAANLFVVTAENIELADAFCNRRRREQQAIAQADRLARQMQSEIERRTARERAGRLRLIVPGGPAVPASAPVPVRPAAAAPTPGVWTRVRNLARLSR